MIGTLLKLVGIVAVAVVGGLATGIIQTPWYVPLALTLG